MQGKPVLAILISILLLYAGVAAAQTVLAGFQIVAENEESELYFNYDSVELAVRWKATGHIWYSNPPERASQETIARGTSKGLLNSQLIITYYANNEQHQMDSYNDSVLHDQYTVTLIPDGIRVDYHLGRKWQDRDYLPAIISRERFEEEILSKTTSEADRKFLRDQYALFGLEEGYDNVDEIGILGVDLHQLLGPYGLRVEEPKFRVADQRRVLQEYLKLVRDAFKYETLGEIKPEDISGLYNRQVLLLKWNAMQWDLDAAVELVKELGYTPEKVAEDHRQFNVEPPFPNIRNFRAALEYTLDGPDLIVRLPWESVSYPEKVYDEKNGREVSYPLTAVSILRYFGAADAESEGYIFVPDGAGALIDFRTDQADLEPYASRVYGPDFASLPVAEYSASLKEQIYLPVYGLKRGEQAFLAIIESGDAVARLEATVYGMRDSYHKVWASFDIRPSARVNMEAEGDLIHLRRLSINMYQARLIQSDIIIRYSFLGGEDASYAGMARLYQNYLLQRHFLTPLPAKSGSLPLVLEIIGSIDRVQPVLGLPLNVVEPLTTFRQSLEIVDDLARRGIEDLVVRYLGWMQGGIRHVFPVGAPLEKKVGNNRDLEKLLTEFEKRGIELFPSVDFQLVHRRLPLGSFIGFRDAARALNRTSAYINTYNIATYQAMDTARIPILSPGKLDGVLNRFLQDYSQHHIPGLASGDLGWKLYADYRLKAKEVIDRQNAQEIVKSQAAKIVANGLDLMLQGGNAYVLPYAKYVVQAPLYSRSLAILDRTIPFYPLVLSGYVGYAGHPYNLADRQGRFYILKLLETGALPYFTVAGSTSAKVKNTDFDYLTSIYYQDLARDIAELYGEIKPILGRVWPQRIVDHATLADDVYQTIYEDGTMIFVNYTPRVYIDETRGLEIPAEGYVAW